MNGTLPFSLTEVILYACGSNFGFIDLLTGSAINHLQQFGLTQAEAFKSLWTSFSEQFPRQTCCYLGPQNGMGGMAISIAGQNRAMLNVWQFLNVRKSNKKFLIAWSHFSPLRLQQDTQPQKYLSPTRLSCIALSHNGIYLLAGTFDGRLLLWEVCLEQ